MNKIKTILKCIVFCMGIILLVAICDYCFGQAGYVRYVLKNINDTSMNYDTIVLGASHARSAIDPQKFDDKMGTNSFSLAIPGETVKDSYYLLKEACRENDIKKVVLDVDYQYWFEPQGEGYANETFICAQFDWSSPTKWQYIVDNMDITDVRYAFTKRVAYAGTPSDVINNIKLKSTRGYKEANIYSLDVPDANGPYKGKGFFSRLTSGSPPGGLDYVISFSSVAYNDISELVIEQFEKINEFCKENNIELICVTSPITPSAMEILHMDVVNNKLQSFFDKYDIDYYNFNMARIDVLPRYDVDFGDCEGHMGGELGERYSEVLARVLSDYENGSINSTDYFYDSFDEMYKDMENDKDIFTVEK